MGGSVKPMATQNEIALHLDLSVKSVREVGQRLGLPSRDCDLDVFRLAYVRHIREVASGRGPKAGVTLDLAEEKLRLAAAKRGLAEIQLAERKGSVVNMKEYDDKTFAFHRALRERFFSIPSRVAGILTVLDDIHEIEAVIRDELAAAMSEVATQ